MPKPAPARPKSAKPVSTRKHFKRKRLPPQVPPAPDQRLWHLYRVNRFKTIFWQLPITFLSERDAEMEASWLGSLAVVQGESYFYIALDGPSSLHLWLGDDVRVGKLPAHYRQTGRKPPGAGTYDNDNIDIIMEESGWWVE